MASELDDKLAEVVQQLMKWAYRSKEERLRKEPCGYSNKVDKSNERHGWPVNIRNNTG